MGQLSIDFIETYILILWIVDRFMIDIDTNYRMTNYP